MEPGHERSLRRRVYELLEPGSEDRTALVVDLVLIALVLVSVTAVALETVPWMAERWSAWFVTAELLTVVIFTVEYGLRVWCSPEHAPWRHKPDWKARLAYLRQPHAIVDVIAIVPFYTALILDDGDLKSLLILRLFRFFKLARYSPGVQSLLDAIYAERRALLGCGVLLLGTVVLCASFMYYAEHEAQPDKLGTIPDAMYWAVVTLSTVGYGDVTPITPLGRIVAGLTAVTGIVMLALPVGIVASAFQQEIHQRDFVVTWSMVAKVPLFAALEAVEVAEIMRYLRARSCESGEIVVRRGEDADAIYFLVSGEVEVRMADGERRLGPGEFFGEIAVLRGGERTATVVAVADSKLLWLGVHDLRHLMDHSPEMARRIKEQARERLKDRGETGEEPLGEE